MNNYISNNIHNFTCKSYNFYEINMEKKIMIIVKMNIYYKS